MTNTKIIIIFYTRYGNTAKMAEAEATGAGVVLRRIADNVLKKSY